ncbi:MAG: sulfatase [Cyanobacteriota bacterium]|nr:sulfatase [Cyanobacteriota bacterium]
MNANRQDKTYGLAVYLAIAILSAVTVILCFTNPRVWMGLGKAVALEPTKPNIVVIMTDDLTVGQLNLAVRQGWMPNLKHHVIDRGTTFTKSFVSDSLCCPSRATFLTGQYPHNHGVLDNELPIGGVTKLNDNFTIATCLQKAGYRTGHVGKYLNRYGEDQVKDNPTDDPTYVPPGWDSWQATIDKSTYSVYNYIINDNGKLIQYGSAPNDYQTDVLARRAVNFINQSQKLDAKPFFLVITPLAPHFEANQGRYPMNFGVQNTIRPAPRHKGSASNILLPRPYSFNEQDVSDKPVWLKNNIRGLSPENINNLQTIYRDKLESMRAVDDLVGSVVSALETNQELDNTAIFFTSDNGYTFGEHRLWQKMYPYEEAIRVPLLIRVPDNLARRISDRFVLNNDLAPTIVELAGAVPEIEMDGRSLIPLLRKPNIPIWRKRFLIEHWNAAQFRLLPTYAAVRTSSAATQTPNQVYVQYEGGEREFYDLTSDPSQLQSLHERGGKPALQVKILQFWLNKLMQCKGKSCQTLEDL